MHKRGLVYICVVPYCVISETLQATDTPIAPGAPDLGLSYYSPIKELGILGEMTESRTIIGNTRDEPTAYGSNNVRKYLRSTQKECVKKTQHHRGTKDTQRTPKSWRWSTLLSNLNEVLDYTLKCKINISRSRLI